MTDQPDFFTQLGEQQIVAAQRAKNRAAEKRQAKAPMVPVTELEKEQRRQWQQTKRWRHDRRQRIREAMEKAEHHGWRELTRALRRLDLERPGDLVDYIRGAAWIHAADKDTRYLVLSVIDTAIVRLRERNGLEPFDDALPGEPDTAFQAIRKLIIPESSPAASIAQR